MATLTERTQLFEISGVYQMQDLREMFQDIALEGVARPNDALVVPKSGTVANPDAGGGARNMTVDVLGADAGGPAGVWVTGDTTPGTEGIYRQPLNTARYNLSVTSNSSGSDRVDNVNLRISAASQVGILEIQAGTPGAGQPTAPASTVTLAYITIPSGTTVITNAMLTDVRPGVRRRSYFAYMADTTGDTASPNFRLPQSAWTNIPQLSATFTLPRDQAVLITGVLQANADVSAAGTGQVYLDVTDNGTSLGLFTGPVEVGASGVGSKQVVSLPLRVVNLASGAHTLRLQAGRDGAGVVNAMAPTTINARTVRRTWFQVVV